MLLVKVVLDDDMAEVLSTLEVWEAFANTLAKKLGGKLWGYEPETDAPVLEVPNVPDNMWEPEHGYFTLELLAENDVTML